jgi:DNA modification methylase
MGEKWQSGNVTLYHGDCLVEMDKIPDQSVDAVITDPPYPCINRDYGYWTVDEWWTLIVDGVIPQVRRILKPTGSAVFILQPNSEHVGQMRGWLWEFMAWVCREWNMIQDVWWWNPNASPGVHVHADIGLLRPSVKLCLWAGLSASFRNQSAIMWKASDAVLTDKRMERALHYTPSGTSWRPGRARQRAKETGRSTPFNLLPITNGQQRDGHGAGTPLKLADWWIRYIVLPGGVVCDPFIGSGTMGLAALRNGCSIIGIEKFPLPGPITKDNPDYFGIAQRRIDKELAMPYQLEFENA